MKIHLYGEDVPLLLLALVLDCERRRGAFEIRLFASSSPQAPSKLTLLPSFPHPCAFWHQSSRIWLEGMTGLPAGGVASGVVLGPDQKISPVAPILTSRALADSLGQRCIEREIRVIRSVKSGNFTLSASDISIELAPQDAVPATAVRLDAEALDNCDRAELGTVTLAGDRQLQYARVGRHLVLRCTDVPDDEFAAVFIWSLAQENFAGFPARLQLHAQTADRVDRSLAVRIDAVREGGPLRIVIHASPEARCALGPSIAFHIRSIISEFFPSIFAGQNPLAPNGLPALPSPAPEADESASLSILRSASRTAGSTLSPNSGRASTTARMARRSA